MKKNIIYLFLVLILSFIGTEIVLNHLTYKNYSDSCIAYEDFLMNKLVRIWSGPKRAWLQPPFVIFKNLSIENQDRLLEIANFYLYPKSTELCDLDFLKPNSGDRFCITTNSLGLRGKEFPQKSRSKKIILFLGTYQTFGQGVNDHERLVAQVEQKLNGSDTKYKYDVVGIGAPAATAIMGLAAWRRWGENLAPDFVVLDFGMVDVATKTYDYIPEEEEEFRGLQLKEKISDFREIFSDISSLPMKISIIRKSILYKRFFSWVRGNHDLNNRIQEWTSVYNVLSNELTFKKIPHVMINQISRPIENYQEVSKKTGIEFWNIRDPLYKNRPNQQQIKDFILADNWTRELAPNKELILSCDSYLRDLPTFLNSVYQLNPKGNELVAESLAEKIRNRFEK